MVMCRALNQINVDVLQEIITPGPTTPKFFHTESCTLLENKDNVCLSFVSSLQCVHRQTHVTRHAKSFTKAPDRRQSMTVYSVKKQRDATWPKSHARAELTLR